MSEFELIAVGGTGQWFLLELCLRRARDPGAPFPSAIHIIDPDQPVPSQTDRIPQVLADALLRQGVTARWYRPVFAPGLSTLAEACPDRSTLPRVAAGNDPDADEHTLPVDDGFFGRPRLTAICVSLGGIVGTGGDPPSFLLPRELEAPGPALLVVGSLMGGTGAGILPLLLQRLRPGVPGAWQRAVTVVALLPWFQPTGAGAPDWRQVCANAEHGVAALADIAKKQRERPGLDAARAMTRVVLVGPSLEEAKGLFATDPSLRPRACLESGATPAVLGEVAEAVKALLAPRNQTVAPTADTLYITGSLAGASVLVDTTQREGEAIPLATAQRRFANLQAGALAALPYADALRLFGMRVPRPGGFGTVLGAALRSSVLGTRTEEAAFWKAFRRRLADLAGSVERLPASGEFSATIARDPDGAIGTLDGLAPKKPALEVANLADTASRDGEGGGTKAAELVHRILLLQVGARKLRPETVRYSRLLPYTAKDELDPPQNAEGVFITQDGDPVRAALMTTLRNAAARGPEDAHSRSWATVLGFVHVLGEAIFRQRTVRVPPGPSTARGRALALWRAAIRGCLEWRPLVGSDETFESFITPTEGSAWQTITGGPKPMGVYLHTEKVAATGFPVPSHLPALGILTTDVGFVPRTEVLDGDALPAEWQALARLLSAGDEANDYLLLATWARHTLPAPIAGSEPRWYQLLQNAVATGTFPDNGAVPSVLLDRETVKGPSLRLERGTGLFDARLPLRVRAVDDVHRIFGVGYPRIVRQVGGRIVYTPFEDADQHELAHIDDSNHPAWLDEDRISEAAECLPPASPKPTHLIWG